MEIDKQYFQCLPKTLLTVEETEKIAKAKKEKFTEFVIALLEIDYCRHKILDIWEEKHNTNKPVTKLAEYYGSSRYTKEELREQINIHLNAAADLEESNAPIYEVIKQILAAQLVGTLYEKIYRSIKPIEELKNKYKDYVIERNKMIAANLALVPGIAAEFANFGISLLDLIQEGNLGLTRAAEKYDPSLGIKFGSYATWWIKQAIRRAVKNNRRDVRVPHHIHDQITKVRNFRTSFKNKNNREPSIIEIEEGTKIKREKIQKSVELSPFPISLETPISIGNKQQTLKDIVEDEASLIRIETDLQREELNKAIISTLDSREAAIIRGRFGLEDEEKKLTKLAAEWGVSKERIRQIETIALEKLKKHYYG